MHEPTPKYDYYKEIEKWLGWIKDAEEDED